LTDISDGTTSNKKLQYKLNKLFIAEVKTLSKLFWNKYEPEETLGIQSAFAKT